MAAPVFEWKTRARWPLHRLTIIPRAFPAWREAADAAHTFSSRGSLPVSSCLQLCPQPVWNRITRRHRLYMSAASPQWTLTMNGSLTLTLQAFSRLRENYIYTRLPVFFLIWIFNKIDILGFEPTHIFFLGGGGQKNLDYWTYFHETWWKDVTRPRKNPFTVRVGEDLGKGANPGFKKKSLSLTLGVGFLGVFLDNLDIFTNYPGNNTWILMKGISVCRWVR